MGYRKPLHYTDVRSQILTAGHELNDHHNDGFIQWEIKKELYRLKFLINEILTNSGSFVSEEEFLEEEAKRKTWSILHK